MRAGGLRRCNQIRDPRWPLAQRCGGLVHHLIACSVHASPVGTQRGDARGAGAPAEDPQLALAGGGEVAEREALGLARAQEAPPVGHEHQLVDEAGGVVLARHLDNGLALEEGHLHAVGSVAANQRSPGKAIL